MEKEIVNEEAFRVTSHAESDVTARQLCTSKQPNMRCFGMWYLLAQPHDSRLRLGRRTLRVHVPN